MINTLKFLVPRRVRNILRAPVRSMKAVIKRWSYQISGPERIRIRPNWEVLCHPASSLIFRHFLDDPELVNELDGFIKRCSPGMAFLDIGCHYGFFTLAAAKFGGDEAIIVAVDPSNGVSKVFDENVQLAKVSDRVTFLPIAVGSTNGSIDMLTTDEAGEQMFIVSPVRRDTRKIQMRSIDSIVADMKRLPTHLKIDVEGFENDVLKGGIAFIAAHRPIIFLELHSKMMREQNRDPHEVLKQLAGLGYRFIHDESSITPDDAVGLGLCRLVCVWE